MAVNNTKTILVHPMLGEQEFSFAHAEKLMGMANNGGWKYKAKKEKKKVKKEDEIKD